jgi:SAM-dependent methyltransferase
LVGADAGTILDFGCGIGLGIAALREFFPTSKIVGCDPSEESLAVARNHEPGAEFFKPNEIEPTGQFDIITAVSVFHHIAPPDRDSALRYCYERLKPGGHLFIFEHNPYNPLTRHLVSRCALDRNALLLPPKETVTRTARAGFDRITAQYCLFFPKVLAWLRPIESSLGWLPLGGQYYVCGIRP